jgi:hypothetical protein
VACGLIKIIKGYHMNFFMSSNSPIDKSYDGYTVSPVVVAGGLPKLFILGNAFRYGK